MILEHLPPSFFQQDIRRLALSRRWYSLAFPAFYPRIEYTPRVISRLVHRKSAALDRSRALLRKSLRSVHIVLEGLPPITTLVPGSGGGGGATAGDPDLAVYNTPSNLARFLLMLFECHELTRIHFTARWQNQSWRADPLQHRSGGGSSSSSGGSGSGGRGGGGGYLCIHTLEPYLGLLTNVTSLDLDLCGTDVVDITGHPVHFCESVRPLLGRLKTLRLRLRRICHFALWPLEGEGEGKGGAVTLGELRLSVYLGRVSENNPKLNASSSCASPAGWGWSSPMDELRARMRALVKVMREPRRAVMEHLAPSGEVHVWDANTGVCARYGSEKPRRFPLCFEEQLSRTCFSENADYWEWDDEARVGGIPFAYSTGEVSDGDDTDEPEEPEELDEVSEAEDIDMDDDVTTSFAVSV
ncbi:hypothetical protein NEMBOFW57_010214 [Staphylotrichum longicolle]|uniref:Uncharacterized protein n=1 Tax=Staphylotrichum longicolle TaxID=669026 RepID=A0AAD4HWM8_9PEZI|nr:hypothetical protein NEMBOFW57_010214 [Staphylotrichum longicolle]